MVHEVVRKERGHHDDAAQPAQLADDAQRHVAVAEDVLPTVGAGVAGRAVRRRLPWRRTPQHAMRQPRDQEAWRRHHEKDPRPIHHLQQLRDRDGREPEAQQRGHHLLDADVQAMPLRRRGVHRGDDAGRDEGPFRETHRRTDDDEASDAGGEPAQPGQHRESRQRRDDHALEAQLVGQPAGEQRREAPGDGERAGDVPEVLVVQPEVPHEQGHQRHDEESIDADEAQAQRHQRHGLPFIARRPHGLADGRFDRYCIPSKGDWSHDEFLCRRDCRLPARMSGKVDAIASGEAKYRRAPHQRPTMNIDLVISKSDQARASAMPAQRWRPHASIARSRAWVIARFFDGEKLGEMPLWGENASPFGARTLRSRLRKHAISSASAELHPSSIPRFDGSPPA